jgi:hypothetical protein
MKKLLAVALFFVVLPLSAVASTYSLLLERDTDTSGQTDLFLITFPTFDDLVNSTNFTQFASQIPLDPAFSVGGLAYDGSYQLLLERDTDTLGQTDLFLITFPTIADLVNSTNFTQFASQIPLDPAFSVGGLTYDGSYQLLLERDTDTLGQTDLFLITFPTIADLVNSTNFTQFASQIPLDPAFSVGGLAYDGFPQPPVVVPEPPMSLLLLAGMGGLIFVLRRKGRRLG